MLLDAVWEALKSFGNPELWLFIGLGVFLGLVFGLVPGITGLTACALILPFVFKMTLWQALPLMIAVLAVTYNGGAVSAILLNVPGTAGNAPTTIDGFRMTQKGEAARALGASQAASGVGGIVSTFVALLLIPLILPMVMSIQSADMVFIILFGLAYVGILSSGSMMKGFVSAALGLLLASIGYHAVTGLARYTFGIGYLYEGISLVPVALGLFAVPEMVRLAARGGSLTTKELMGGMRGVWRGVGDVFRHWLLTMRGAIIGFVVGILPGIGGSAASIISYAQAKQISRHPEEFGTGTVEGVIAPESANNACEAGDLLTTLALGIPGSAGMALVIGAIIILGVVPGPDMLTMHLDLSIALMLVIIISGVIGSVICIGLASYLAKIALLPGHILAPIVLVIAFVGGFATTGQMEDVLVILVISAIGLVMARYGYNRPAFFLAYILGGYFERYLFISVQARGPLFFLRPISLTLIVILIATFAYGPIKGLILRRRGAKR